jgi:hypothetical protein
MSELSRYNLYIDSILPGMSEYDFVDKSKCRAAHVAYMLDRLQSMFRWEGLPDTIPQRILELYLMINGNVCFYEHEGDLYVYTGGMGGEPDVYYMPTIYTIANPAQRLSVNAKIDEDCVVIPNDSLYIGMMPLCRRYAEALTENELSMNIGIINTRIIDYISAPDDRTKKAAEEFLAQVKNGNLGVIADNAFLDGIRVAPSGQTGARNSLTSLIETEQYLKGSWFQEIGLQASFNMKREALNSAESEIDNDSLLPLVDDMLKQRQLGAERVNAMFGTEISVTLASSWEDNAVELDAVLEKMENEAEAEEPEEDAAGETEEESVGEPEEESEEETEEEPEEDTEEEPEEDTEEEPEEDTEEEPEEDTEEEPEEDTEEEDEDDEETK